MRFFSFPRVAAICFSTHDRGVAGAARTVLLILLVAVSEIIRLQEGYSWWKLANDGVFVFLFHYLWLYAKYIEQPYARLACFMLLAVALGCSGIQIFRNIRKYTQDDEFNVWGLFDFGRVSMYIFVTSSIMRATEKGSVPTPSDPSLHMGGCGVILQLEKKFETFFLGFEACFIVLYCGFRVAYGPWLLFLVSEAEDRDQHTLRLFLSRFHEALALACFALRIFRCSSVQRYEMSTTCCFGVILNTCGILWSLALMSSGVVHSAVNVVLSSSLFYLLVFVLPSQATSVICFAAPFCCICGAAAFQVALGSQESQLLGFVDVFLIMLSTTLVSVARRCMCGIIMQHDSTREKAKLELESLQRDLVHEKVKRCQAEFQLESVRKTISRSHVDCTAHSLAAASNHDHDALLRETLREDYPQLVFEDDHSCASAAKVSNGSAPAVMEGTCRHSGLDRSESSQTCTQNDCLSPTSLVWVEGAAMPWAVSDLSAGQRILCFDHLGGTLKHTEVIEVSQNYGPTTWADVVLADGTTLTVTADHPMHVRNVKSDRATCWGGGATYKMRAQDLSSDMRLHVLKVEEVAVQSVTLRTEISSSVAVSVHQPSRHTLFVGSKRQYGSVQALAIGSVSTPFDDGVHIQHRNTFLNVEETRDEYSRESSRAESSPAILYGKEMSARSLEPDTADGPDVLVSREISEEASNLSATSTLQSADTNGSTEVVLKPAPSQRDSDERVNSGVTSDVERGESSGTQGHFGCESVSLQEVLSLHSTGMNSVGGHLHKHGTCFVCIHENRARYQSNRPSCRFGALCSYCHADHEDVMRAKRQRQNEYRKQKKQQAGSQQ
eukprot:TRINITY_DN7453_c1_g1_i1.p1 TRINITY_DN7453_c1_g1~~TRINITY_DN7453_c1_g1_i1.p1  ORF type:complete len:837 (+),score=71.34 TRINITY_DN7453_c1_g1_i1:56-2566(+)